MVLGARSAGDLVADSFTLSGCGVFGDLGITNFATKLAFQKGETRSATRGGRREVDGEPQVLRRVVDASEDLRRSAGRHIRAARPGADKDQLAGNVGRLPHNLLRNHAADGKTQEIDPGKAEGADEGARVRAHPRDIGRHLAGTRRDTGIVEQDDFAGLGETISHSRVPIVHRASEMLIEDNWHALGIAEAAVAEADAVGFHELGRCGVVSIPAHLACPQIQRHAPPALHLVKSRFSAPPVKPCRHPLRGCKRLCKFAEHAYQAWYPKMELRHLRYFIAVAEEGSVTLAAQKRLHTAQPSLSRQIRALEDEVGVPLMSRGVRGIVLTAAGQAFLEHAKLVLAQTRMATEAARRAASPAKPSLAVGVLVGHETDWLPRSTILLRDELFSAEIKVSSGFSTTLASDLQSGALDVAFLRHELDTDLAFKMVETEPLVAILPSDHPLALKDAVHPRDFAGETFIGISEIPRILRAAVNGYLRRCGVEIVPHLEIDNFAMAISLVTSTRGVALLPASIKDVLPWSVVSRPLRGDQPTIDLMVGYRRDNDSPMLRLFLEKLEELLVRMAREPTSEHHLGPRPDALPVKRSVACHGRRMDRADMVSDFGKLKMAYRATAMGRKPPFARTR